MSTNIKKCRIRTGLTQEEAAKKIGVHPTTLNKYESGARYPSGKVLANMAQQYNAPLETLLSSASANKLGVETAIIKPDEVETKTMEHVRRLEAELLELYRENRDLKDALGEYEKKARAHNKVINGD